MGAFPITLKGGESMGKTKPPKGLHRVSIHDGSSVTQSVLRVNPASGKGKHAKTVGEIVKRHKHNVFMRMLRRYLEQHSRPNYMNK